MKILAIGTDRKLFEENLLGQGSAVLTRQLKYAKLFERTDIIVYALKSLGLKPKSYGNLNIYPTNSSSRFLYFVDAVKVSKNLDKPDIITAQDAFESGIAAYLVSRYFKVPLCLQIHTDFLSPFYANESLLNRLRVLIAKFLIKRADRVRVVTERIKRSIADAGLTTEDKIEVLPVFVDTESIRNSLVTEDLHRKYPQFEFVILMASRITKEKNIGLAIDAIREVVKKYPKTGLVIVGDGPEKDSLEERINKYGLSLNIILEKWNNNLASYYKTADLFLLTSNYEGYGMTVIESLSAGTPVLMSDVGVAGEVLINEQNGLTFPVGDLSALTASMERFISDSVLRDSIKNSSDKFIPRINEAEYAVKYKKIFEVTTQ